MMILIFFFPAAWKCNISDYLLCL